MPKPHVHLLLPASDWTTAGFTWCLRCYQTLIPAGHRPLVTDLLEHTTCPRCRELFSAAEAEKGHPLREYRMLDTLMKNVQLKSPASVAAFCRHLVHEPQEVVLCLMATVTLRLLHVQELFRGTLTESLFHPREIFRAVLAQNAYGFLLVHNHPSGEVEPSEQDLRVTQQLLRCSELMQLPFLDHLVVARQGYYSLREQTRLWDET